MAALAEAEMPSSPAAVASDSLRLLLAATRPTTHSPGFLGGGVGKRPMPTLSALVAFDMVISNTRGCSGGKRFLSSYFAHRRPAKSAVFRPRPLCMVKPAGAIASSWSRLLARLPHKV